MKKDYTILAPNMLPCHFKMYIQILKNYGYNVELLETKGKNITEAGLKYVHNDTCYPAIVVIGQFLDAIQSGRYNTDKLALIMFQTGGGCRASNYIFLVRKALRRAGYGHIPVISLSLQNIEPHPGFRMTVPILYKMLFASLYGDLLLLLENQCKPYEINKGDTENVTTQLTKKLTAEMNKKRFNVASARKTFQKIINAYAAIEKTNESKLKVGIVGEIFVKFSPSGNNGLEKFLVEEGAEAVIPGFLDFLIYSVYNNIIDYKFYRRSKMAYPGYKLAYTILTHMQKVMIETVKRMEDSDLQLRCIG